MKRTVARGASDDELALFLAVAKKHRLDPFTRQLHLVPRYDSRLGCEVRMIQIGIDGYRQMASRYKDFGGIDEPEYEVEADGVTLKFARVRVWKKGFDHPSVGIAFWAEYAPRNLDAPQSFMWKKMPRLMLAKCAEALALRKAHPDLSDIYTDEEMWAEPPHPSIDELRSGLPQAQASPDATPDSAPTEPAIPPKGGPSHTATGDLSPGPANAARVSQPSTLAEGTPNAAGGAGVQLIRPTDAVGFWTKARSYGWTEPQAKAIYNSMGFAHISEVLKSAYPELMKRLEDGPQSRSRNFQQPAESESIVITGRLTFKKLSPKSAASPWILVAVGKDNLFCFDTKIFDAVSKREGQEVRAYCLEREGKKGKYLSLISVEGIGEHP